MKRSRLPRYRVVHAFAITLVSILLSGFFFYSTAVGQERKPLAAQPTSPVTQPEVTRLPNAEGAEAWHETMSRRPAPRTGCSKASYPYIGWQQIPCTTAPLRPHFLASRRAPAGEPSPRIVGGGVNNDFVAGSSGIISSATGSFYTVTGVTSESSQPTANSPPNTPIVANGFSLQLNTQFDPLLCSQLNSQGNPTCYFALQQFVFDNQTCPSAITSARHKMRPVRS